MNLDAFLILLPLASVNGLVFSNSMALASNYALDILKAIPNLIIKRRAFVQFVQMPVYFTDQLNCNI